MIIRSDSDRNEFIRKILALPLSPDKPREFTASLYKPKRSAEQRRLQFMWYTEIGKGTGEGKDYIELYCKFTFGCPILVRDDPQFAEIYDGLINKYTYEEMINMMTVLDVTRQMGVHQNAEYLKMIDNYATERGVQITKPIDAYTLALGEQYEQTHSSK